LPGAVPGEARKDFNGALEIEPAGINGQRSNLLALLVIGGGNRSNRLAQSIRYADPGNVSNE